MNKEKFRPNVALVIVNQKGEVLVGERQKISGAWQFPQGGIEDNETPEQAAARELREETCFNADQVNILAATDWFYYEYPQHIIKSQQRSDYIGQKQKWFLLSLRKEIDPHLVDNAENNEFRNLKWAPYWYTLDKIVDFKYIVYHDALTLLYPIYKKYFRI